MIKSVYVIAVVAAAAAVAMPRAMAQQQPPAAFAPFTVDEKTYTDLKGYLMQQPYMFAAPMMAWLEGSAAKAKADAAAKAAEDGKKPDEVKPSP